MFEVQHFIKINAAPAKVYEAISTAAGIRQWWTNDAALDPKVGGAAEFGFYGHQFVIKAKVASATAGKSVAWTDVTSNPGGGFDGTTIAFDVRPEESHVASGAPCDLCDSRNVFRPRRNSRTFPGSNRRATV